MCGGSLLTRLAPGLDRRQRLPRARSAPAATAPVPSRPIRRADAPALSGSCRGLPSCCRRRRWCSTTTAARRCRRARTRRTPTRCRCRPSRVEEPVAVEPGTLPPQIVALVSEITTVLTADFPLYPPHTIQRLAEMILWPTRHYRSLPAYLHALDRVVHVTSGANMYPLPPAVADMSSMAGVVVSPSTSLPGANGERWRPRPRCRRRRRDRRRQPWRRPADAHPVAAAARRQRGARHRRRGRRRRCSRSRRGGGGPRRARRRGTAAERQREIGGPGPHREHRDHRGPQRRRQHRDGQHIGQRHPQPRPTAPCSSTSSSGA